MAYIDELYALASSLQEKDTESIVRICQFLYRRLSDGDFGSHLLGEPAECTKIRITNSGFTLSFSSNHIHYCRDGGRWLVCEQPDERPRLDDPHHAAVERLSAPYAFLEGLAYGILCVEAVGMSEVENHRARGKAHELDAALKKYLYWSREIEQMEKRFRSARFQRMSRERSAKLQEQHEYDAPPPPPTETTSMDVALSAFEGLSGVYFLWNSEDEIEYIGRADNISKRLRTNHHVATFEHRVSIVETTKEESHLVELWYIWKYRPKSNGQVKSSLCAASGEPQRRRRKAASR